MSAMPDCDKVLLVQAELDGELGAAEAAALAAHRAQCPICEAAAAELAQARALMRDDLYQPVPEDMRRRVLTALAAAQPPRPGLSIATSDSFQCDRASDSRVDFCNRCAKRCPEIRNTSFYCTIATRRFRLVWTKKSRDGVLQY